MISNGFRATLGVSDSNVKIHIRKKFPVITYPDGLCPRGYRQEAPQLERFALHFVTAIVSHSVREDALAASVSGQRLRNARGRSVQPTDSIRLLTGQ